MINRDYFNIFLLFKNYSNLLFEEINPCENFLTNKYTLIRIKREPNILFCMKEFIFSSVNELNKSFFNKVFILQKKKKMTFLCSSEYRINCTRCLFYRMFFIYIMRSVKCI